MLYLTLREVSTTSRKTSSGSSSRKHYFARAIVDRWFDSPWSLARDRVSCFFIIIFFYFSCFSTPARPAQPVCESAPRSRTHLLSRPTSCPRFGRNWRNRKKAVQISDKVAAGFPRLRAFSPYLRHAVRKVLSGIGRFADNTTRNSWQSGRTPPKRRTSRYTRLSTMDLTDDCAHSWWFLSCLFHSLNFRPSRLLRYSWLRRLFLRCHRTSSYSIVNDDRRLHSGSLYCSPFASQYRCCNSIPQELASARRERLRSSSQRTKRKQRRIRSSRIEMNTEYRSILSDQLAKLSRRRVH